MNREGRWWGGRLNTLMPSPPATEVLVAVLLLPPLLPSDELQQLGRYQPTSQKPLTPVRVPERIDEKPPHTHTHTPVLMSIHNRKGKKTGTQGHGAAHFSLSDSKLEGETAVHWGAFTCRFK